MAFDVKLHIRKLFQPKSAQIAAFKNLKNEIQRRWDFINKLSAECKKLNDEVIPTLHQRALEKFDQESCDQLLAARRRHEDVFSLRNLLLQNANEVILAFSRKPENLRTIALALEHVGNTIGSEIARVEKFERENNTKNGFGDCGDSPALAKLREELQFVLRKHGELKAGDFVDPIAECDLILAKYLD
ncbi:MAG: hypothetical protein PHV34_01810 [Verrucomicrobiae bacterium]|nr:hypothetical protein [Verrucomicrobiae bacterium]